MSNGAPIACRREPLSAEEFARSADVPRETLDRLKTYLALLEKWQGRINLVGASTLRDPWRRHFLDSAQVVPLIPRPGAVIVDLGSGAGFPGMVLAIMGAGAVHLIESDQRKATFLREVARQTRTDVVVHPRRIEAVTPFAADIVTARALAPLDRLIRLAQRFDGGNTLCLFLKGQDVGKELTEATKRRIVSADRIASMTDSRGAILRIALSSVEEPGRA